MRWYSPFGPLDLRLGEGHMGQISMKIKPLPGSLLSGNQHDGATRSECERQAQIMRDALDEDFEKLRKEYEP